MRIELLKASDLTDELWQAFADLRDANPLYDDPFFDPAYTRLVARVRPDVHVIIASESDAPVAFWPLHCRKGGWARPIGGPFSDWHGPVLGRDCEVTSAELLEGAGLAGFTGFAMPTALSGMSSKARCGAHMTDLTGGWDVFQENQQALYPKHFKKVRRVTRNLERDYSENEYTLDDRSDEAFDWLIEKKRAQYIRTGRHDVLGPQWAQELMSSLRTHQSTRMRARLSTLRVDGQFAAAEYNLLSDHLVHGWITVYDETFAKYAPGFLLQHNILRRMPLCGLRIYDSGPGLDHYKKYYSNFHLPLDAGIILPEGPAVSPARLLGNSWKATESLAPAGIARLMGKVRRRSDQILLAETNFGDRAKGFARALLP